MNKFKDIQFEKEKNAKAIGYTFGIALALLLIFFLASWETPKPELPIKEDLVYVDLGEMNLGNTDEGMGKIQPLIPGDFAAEQQQNARTKATPTAPEEVADVPTDDNNSDENTPQIVKQTQRPETPGRKIADRQVTNNSNTRNNNNTPSETVVTPPKPKAAMGAPGHSGPGGNNADEYNNSRSQGNGNRFGDQGDPNGSPNGNGTGPRRLNNTHIRNLGQIQRMAEQSGTNYKGRIIMELTVDAEGNVTSVKSAVPSPVSDGSADAKSFARRIAPQIKFSPGADGRTATVSLNFNF